MVGLLKKNTQEEEKRKKKNLSWKKILLVQIMKFIPRLDKIRKAYTQNKNVIWLEAELQVYSWLALRGRLKRGEKNKKKPPGKNGKILPFLSLIHI